jgi:uroporphyrinogen-III synthase
VRHQVQAGQSVLIVRGNDALPDVSPDTAPNDEAPADSTGAGRDWLGEQLKAQGAQVQWLAAYERRAPVWDAGQRAAAQHASEDGSVWVFSSSQAIGHLADLLPDVSWSQARALATHPRIAQAARDMGFGQVVQVRPVVADVLASLESIA